MHNDTTTSANSTPALSAEQLMLFPEASHASHTAAPESASANPMIAICGPKCLESFARLPRAGLWAKTFAGLLLGRADWYSKRCRLIWRLRGTRYRRSYFLLQVSTRRMKGTGYGLLPTPVVSTAPYQYSNGDKTRPKTLTLVGVIRYGLLPTPSASDNRDRGGPSMPSVKRRQEIGKQVNLSMCCHGQLNPRFVAQMMGFPPDWLELPFQTIEEQALQVMETP